VAVARKYGDAEVGLRSFFCFKVALLTMSVSQ
jgi:hypothetical protein